MYYFLVVTFNAVDGALFYNYKMKLINNQLIIFLIMAVFNY